MHQLRVLLQNIYDRWQGGEDVSKIPRTDDPFWAPPEDLLIGTANVSLQPLAYAMDFDDKVVVADYNGHEEGYVSVHLAPTTQNGDLLGDDDFVDDPVALMNKPYHFKVCGPRHYLRILQDTSVEAYFHNAIFIGSFYNQFWKTKVSFIHNLPISLYKYLGVSTKLRN